VGMMKFGMKSMMITQNWARVGQQCHDGVTGCNKDKPFEKYFLHYTNFEAVLVF